MDIGFDIISSSQDTVVMGSTEYPIEISSGDSQAVSSVDSQELVTLSNSPEY